MDRKWYEKPLRIAALQCNYENGQTLDVVDKWVDAGFNVEQLFHPMAERYTAVYDPDKHRHMLVKYLAKARRRGLRVILYLNVHIIEPSNSHRREEWAQRDARGEYYKLYETYDACCVNSVWRDHVFKAIDQIGALDVDGLFLDGPSIRGKGCFCPACRELYRKEFGEAMGEESARLKEFNTASIDRFMREAHRLFKARKPDGVFYMNFNLLSGSYLSMPEALDYNDILGTEGGFMFYGPAKAAYMWKPSVSAKVSEAAAPDRPRVIFMAADQKPWSWYMHTPVETQLCIASSVANASSIWYGLHGSTALLDTPGGRAATALMRQLAGHEALYEAAQPASSAAVMHSFDTSRQYHSSSQASDFYGGIRAERSVPGNYLDSLFGYCDALARSSIPFDAVTDLDLSAAAIGRFDCVILPTCACLKDAAIEALREYVRNGGNLIASLDTSLLTDFGRPRADFGLADVFGVSFEGGVTDYGNFNYFSACGAAPVFEGIGIERIPAPHAGMDVRVREGAEVLARFHVPQAGRYVDPTPQGMPAAVLNRFGAGSALYLAGAFGEMLHCHALPEHRRLLVNAVRMFSRQIVTLEGALGNVEVSVRRQPGRLLVHLINYAGVPPRPFEAVAPQTGLRLALSPAIHCRSAKAVFSDVALTMFVEGERTIVELPRLDIYEVIELEQAS